MLVIVYMRPVCHSVFYCMWIYPCLLPSHENKYKFSTFQVFNMYICCIRYSYVACIYQEHFNVFLKDVLLLNNIIYWWTKVDNAYIRLHHSQPLCFITNCYSWLTTKSWSSELGLTNPPSCIMQSVCIWPFTEKITTLQWE